MYNKVPFFYRAKQWIEIIDRTDLLLDDKYLKCHYQICSKHFSCNDFKKTYPRIILKPGVVPLSSTVLENSINTVNIASEHNYSRLTIAGNETENHVNI